MELLPPIYPGEILKEEFLEPMGISQYRLAKEIRPKGTSRTSDLAPHPPTPSPKISEGGFCKGFLSPPPKLGEGLGVGAVFGMYPTGIIMLLFPVGEISVSPRRINEIVHGKRAITPDTALRLSRYFGMSERFWLNLQTRYDLEVTKDRLKERLVNEMQVLAMGTAL